MRFMARSKMTTANRRRQPFVFIDPAAATVLLVGDFTHWEESPIQMERAKDGTFRALVDLTPGEHEYRFVVDGQWRDDPACPSRVANPYGTENSIRQVT
jgi:1,4-alpha-glucan branching enzyme